MHPSFGMARLLLFAAWLLLATAAPTAEELAIVDELERTANETQPGGMYGLENGLVSKRGSHVPRLEQVGWNQFRLRVAHAQTWDPESYHAVEYAYVKTAQGEVVWFKAFSNATGDHVDETFTLQSEHQELLAHEYCNLHGLWQSPGLVVVPGLHWNLTAAGLLNSDRNGAVQDCLEKGTVSIDLGQNREFVDMGKGANDGEWRIGFRFPEATWLGLGINQLSMVGGDVGICQETGGTVSCAAFYVAKRALPTDAARATELSLENWTIQDHVVHAVVVQRAKTTLAAPTKHGESPMVFAFGSIDDHGKPSYHSLDGRGYFSVILSPDGAPAATTGVTQYLGSTHQVQYRTLRSMHGAFMIAAYAFVVTYGAIIARYYRHTAWWLGTHRSLQLIATGMAVANYVMVSVVMKIKYSDEVSGTYAHSYTGTILVTYATLQSLIGSAVYYHGAISSSILGKVHQTDILGEESRLVVRQWALRYGSGNFFIALKENSQTLNPKIREEISQFLVDSVTSMTISRLLSAPFFYSFMFRFPSLALRQLHRVIGRIYVLGAYAQMVNGVRIKSCCYSEGSECFARPLERSDRKSFAGSADRTFRS